MVAEQTSRTVTQCDRHSICAVRSKVVTIIYSHNPEKSSMTHHPTTLYYSLVYYGIVLDCEDSFELFGIEMKRDRRT
jgi:hypothetical protein